jgi:hypothetical protein
MIDQSPFCPPSTHFLARLTACATRLYAELQKRRFSRARVRQNSSPRTPSTMTALGTEEQGSAHHEY